MRQALKHYFAGDATHFAMSLACDALRALHLREEEYLRAE
jgi:hypothetical protein